MALSKALNGLTPAKITGNAPNSTGQSRYRIANGFASDMFTGDLVKVSAGTVQPITTTTDRPIGVFMGCEYVDPVNKRPVWGKRWPASTSSSDTSPYAFVADNPSSVFVIQADATVSLGDVESNNFAVTLGAGSAVTGRSGFGLKAGSRTSLSRNLRIIGNYDIPGNSLGDANAKVLVRLVQHIDTIASIAPAN